MRFYGVALRLKLKELLCHKGYLLVLGILPILIAFLMFMSVAYAEETGLKAGVWWDKDSHMGEKLSTYLMQDDAIHFIAYEEIEQLKKSVAIGEIECGFIISSEIDEKRENHNLSEAITIIKSPATMSAGVMQEIVSGGVYRYISADIAYRVLSEKAYMNQEMDLEEWLKAQVETYYVNGDLMQVDYASGDEVTSKPQQKGEGFVRLAKGLIAVFLLISSMLMGERLSEDYNSQLYQRLYTVKKKAIYPEVALVGANMLMQMLVSLVAMLIIGGKAHLSASELFKEMLLLLVYMSTLSMVVMLGSVWIKSSAMWFSMIPMLIIASIIFCPIVIDLSSMQTPLKYICYLFLPYYYLRGMEMMGVLLGVGAVSGLLYYCFRKKRLQW